MHTDTDTDTDTDLHLLTSYHRRGDAGAFQELVRMHGGMVLSGAGSMTTGSAGVLAMLSVMVMVPASLPVRLRTE